MLSSEMSVLLPKADVLAQTVNVCIVPQADIAKTRIY